MTETDYHWFAESNKLICLVKLPVELLIVPTAAPVNKVLGDVTCVGLLGFSLNVSSSC